MRELPLAERTEYFQRGFLVSQIADLMTAKPEYITSNGNLLGDGEQFLQGILDGYYFIFENGQSNMAMAHENVRLYNLYTKTVPTWPIKGAESAANLRDYVEKVKNHLSSVIKDPGPTSESSKQEVRSFFATLSHAILSELGRR